MSKLLSFFGYEKIKPKPSTKEGFELAMCPAVCVPFNGADMWVKLRQPNQVEIQAAGSFSLIETLTDKRKMKKITTKQILEYSKTQSKLLRAALVSPTYDEIIEAVSKDFYVVNAQKELKSCKDKLSLTSHSNKERGLLEDEIDKLSIAIDLILPHDFIGAVIAWVFGPAKSELSKITEEMLLDAAILAEKGGDNPADHLVSALWSQFNKDDINRRAWIILNDKREKNKKKGNKKRGH
jgi:hypothetical protein